MFTSKLYRQKKREIAHLGLSDTLSSSPSSCVCRQKEKMSIECCETATAVHLRTSRKQTHQLAYSPLADHISNWVLNYRVVSVSLFEFPKVPKQKIEKKNRYVGSLSRRQTRVNKLTLSSMIDPPRWTTFAHSAEMARRWSQPEEGSCSFIEQTDQQSRQLRRLLSKPIDPLHQGYSSISPKTSIFELPRLVFEQLMCRHMYENTPRDTTPLPAHVTLAHWNE